ncbi:MAG TPA: xanthine dehydrogenase family protein molybdopterin-binding subunit [Xanthobacteraceae bacterium]|jgi:carbon-monoxide dehydrogenase large subunit|nr:xanthine dehydrogenase family protein molybdopterin-binding subunit [Xanthobacteraceae bacterium]
MPEAGTVSRAIGQPIRRKEDLRFITGKGRYTDDFSLPQQVYAVMVRSPHPHARILGVTSDKARAMPGVLAVYSGEDCRAAGLKPIPHEAVPSTKHDMKLTAPDGGKVFLGPHWLLAWDKARHVGEAVAMVVAETLAQALDAAEAVEVNYEPLPFVLDADAALAEGAPAIWDEIPDNVPVETHFGDAAATDAAFTRADHVVRMEFHVGRVTAAPIEPRAALGEYDAKTGRYTLHAGTGGAVRQKREIAAVLDVPLEQVRVVTADVGGNFGSKNRPYVEYGLVLWASKMLGRPVKFTATRSEAFLTDSQGRDLVTKVELALRKDGRFLAMRADNISNIGARCMSLSPLSKGSALITGSYDIPAASLRSRAIFTNTMMTQPYRSSGRPEVTYAIERLVDRAAEELKLDRLAIRQMNLVREDQMPYVNAVGARYDSGTYAANMDLVRRIADWDGFPKRRVEAKKRGRLLGLGFANYVESSTGSPRERAEITVLPEGRVRLVIGTQSAGQGQETSFAQVLADLLSVPVASIDTIMGDTDIVSIGGGSHSGRSMRHAATVIAIASQALIERGKAKASHLLDASAENMSFTDGRFAAHGRNRSFDFFDLAREATHVTLPNELQGGLAAAANNEMQEQVFPNGAAVCEVEIDPDNGALELTRYASVDDVGRCINPLIVDGQTHGAIAQGIGEALWEQIYIDPSSGQPLTGSLQDYTLPRAGHLPGFQTEIVEVLSPTNPYGIKAAGEGATTPALAVAISAVLDALAPLGIRDVPMPATSFAIWQEIQTAKTARA